MKRCASCVDIRRVPPGLPAQITMADSDRHDSLNPFVAISDARRRLGSNTPSQETRIDE
jgi:hypothetical protein